MNDHLHHLLLFAVVALLTGCANTGTSPERMPPIASVSTACAVRVVSDVHIATSRVAEQSVERVVVTADPESATSLVARAWDHSRAGDRERTMKLFDLALLRADNNMPVDRIQWSYGWAMFNLNQHRCALAHFEQARLAAPDQIRWLPQTLAVTYWQMGEREVALRWYDEAAKNEPACWISAKAAEACTRHWLRQERQALGHLLTAWRRKRHTLGEG
jgi:tetratricopeptide (TPR) repeat protein